MCSSSKNVVAFLVVFFSVQGLSAQPVTDELWTEVSLQQSLDSLNQLADIAERSETVERMMPDRFRLFDFNPKVFEALASRAIEERNFSPREIFPNESTISLPMPDGSVLNFQLIGSPIMSHELQAKFPTIRAYRGTCLNDPKITMRLDVSPRGEGVALRAQVNMPEGTVIIDPFGSGNENINRHMSFSKSRHRGGIAAHRCILERPVERERNWLQAMRSNADARVQSGGQLRTYRLAVACTGEYSNFHGGTTTSALAAIHSTINRVNEVYEREVAIRFELVGNNDQIIFLNQATDPFTNNNAIILADQSQLVIDSKIGDANYDIGHTFSTGAGGYAPGPVGVSGQKAKGVTGQSNPIGDPFDVDFVAHEIGHQLNADHTFNGTGCNPSARFAPTAVEPGSGSTILAYAGICNNDDLQGNSHDYFNTISLAQIVDYSSFGAGAVGTTQSTGNSIPTVDAGANFTIPSQTPFKLTATGTDPDNDPLMYCWEQVDRGPASAAAAFDDGKIPLFRSFPPSANRSRVFPRWSTILSGTSSIGEQLPSKARTLNFEVTVRDNKSGGGGIHSDSCQVNVVDSAGPFRVTSPSSISIASPILEVKWDVANTNNPPINTSLVNILLSIDGGQTFSETLATNSPNDGNQLVTLPPTARNQLRILVESVDNVFFSINSMDFSVEFAERRVFLVRHAEKGTGLDPSLTENGKRRAQALAQLMVNTGVTHVFSTNTRRTRETAEPTAVAIGRSMQLYSDTASLANEINLLPLGSRVLVIGHSNTLGPLTTALGATEAIQSGEDEFDNLVALGLREGTTTLESYKYSVPSPPSLFGRLNPAVAGVGNETSPTGKLGASLTARDTNAFLGEVIGATVVSGQLGAELWREPQDSDAAINQSDLYAWKLFVALNWPANLEQRQADPNRVFGEHATTVWESWKLSSGRNDQVFLKDGLDPGNWLDTGDENDLKAPFEKRILDFEALPLQQQQRQKTAHAEFDPDRSVNGMNENHMNKEAYEFIRERELYYVEGQEKLFDEAKKLFELAGRQNRLVAAHEYKLHFPVGSKEVKAQWRPITSEDKPRYHWAEFTASDGSKILFGLTALHITTKDVPNWFWATFEHTDNPSRAGAEPWQTQTVDSSAGPKGYPPRLGIEGTRWENYRLRGTQVEFTDSFGDPTILANSQIEQGFQLSSSCITCHARAAIGPRLVGQASANRLSIFKSELPQARGPSIVTGNVGALPVELFVQRTFDNAITGDLTYLQLDFVWSLMRAQRKISSGPLPSEVSFSQHIKPLFRQRDIDAMKSVFDLSKHADVSQHAEAIFSRLSDGSMPCDSPWPSANIELFSKWIEGGKKE